MKCTVCVVSSGNSWLLLFHHLFSLSSFQVIYLVLDGRRTTYILLVTRLQQERTVLVRDM